MISAKVDTSQVVLRFSRLPGNIVSALVPALDKIGIDLVTYIVRDKLSGQVLHRRSGTLSNAITHTAPEVTGTSVGTKVGVFSGVPYARPLEYGAEIPPVSGPLMVFSAKDGSTVFTRKRKGFTLREYAYLRGSLADQRDHIVEQISAAVQGAA